MAERVEYPDNSGMQPPRTEGDYGAEHIKDQCLHLGDVHPHAPQGTYANACVMSRAALPYLFLRYMSNPRVIARFSWRWTGTPGKSMVKLCRGDFHAVEVYDGKDGHYGAIRPDSSLGA